MRNRVIGKYRGNSSGPLTVITAAMHGNEPAGVKALEMLFSMLEREHICNPGFDIHGEVIGIIGNKQAFQLRQRFITKDINRSWYPSYIQNLRNTDNHQLYDEDLEMKEILQLIDVELERVQPEKLFLLDLHTTSSDGGIFCIATQTRESIDIAHDMHVPVVLGLLNGIDGTTLHYFNNDNIGLPTVAVAFEGGQHDDHESIQRCIAASINFLRACGIIDPIHIENRHDRILLDYSKRLPDVVKVKYKFHIDDNIQWAMQPGYRNFQKIKKGEILARYNNEDVTAQMDGMILMPLYQKQGHDGFFIVEEIIEW